MEIGPESAVLCQFFKGILLIAMLTTIYALSFAVDAEIVSGECGDQGDIVTWTLDTETGELVIDGNGAMKNYNNGKESSQSPWYYYFFTITTVTINHGVTNIGDCAFADCFNLTSITIPKNLCHLAQ